MKTIREAALEYKPNTTRNIAELDHFPVDIGIKQEIKTTLDETTGKEREYTIFITEIDGEKYRIPKKVLEGMQGILSRQPETKHFFVVKNGTGKGTTYQTYSYIEKEEKVE
jgi:hypothetical protein